jgi:transposase
VLRRWLLCLGKKGGDGGGKTKRGKGTKWKVVVDGEGVPLACHLGSASLAEVKLLEPTLDHLSVEPIGEATTPQPQRLVCDKAYDSDALRQRLQNERGIEVICPHRKNRRRAALQDGRPLRRYRRRWKVERTFAWLGNFRRLVVRYEHKLLVYQAFFHLACLLITLRQL